MMVQIRLFFKHTSKIRCDKIIACKNRLFIHTFIDLFVHVRVYLQMYTLYTIVLCLCAMYEYTVILHDFNPFFLFAYRFVIFSQTGFSRPVFSIFFVQCSKCMQKIISGLVETQQTCFLS
jgi:hypothetical protein